METYYQGEGSMVPIRGVMPTTNTDDSPYTHGAEDYFRYYITNDEALITDPARFSELLAASPPIGVELVNGVFDKEYDVDAGQLGKWFITLSTVNVLLDSNGNPILDANGNPRSLEGPINNVDYKSLEVLPPLSPPNPPTGLDA